MARSVKVHDDTHEVLKQLKSQRRSRSLDEVIRGLVKESTGVPVEKARPKGKGSELTTYLGE